VSTLLEKILRSRLKAAISADKRVTVLLNNLGTTTDMEMKTCWEISDVAIGAIKQVVGSTTARCGVSYMKTLVAKDHR
jgi:dihydroxyacetone kinase